MIMTKEDVYTLTNAVALGKGIAIQKRNNGGTVDMNLFDEALAILTRIPSEGSGEVVVSKEGTPLPWTVLECENNEPDGSRVVSWDLHHENEDGFTWVAEFGSKEDAEFAAKACNAALQPGKVMTDLDMERIAEVACKGETSQIVQATENGPVYLSQGENIRRHIVAALRYARDNGFLAPATLPVDRIMEVVKAHKRWIHTSPLNPPFERDIEADLRTRLTALSNNG